MEKSFFSVRLCNGIADIREDVAETNYKYESVREGARGGSFGTVPHKTYKGPSSLVYVRWYVCGSGVSRAGCTSVHMQGRVPYLGQY